MFKRFGKIFIGFASMMLLVNSTATPAQAEKKIVINLATRTLALYDDNKKIRLYPIGPGKYATPTPVGYYKILTKEVDPPWINPDDPEFSVPPGYNNPLGRRWMQFHGNYGIHGTNNPGSIGHYVSNGCIRMYEEDVEELFDLVTVGTPVEIMYNRVVVEKDDDNQIVYYVYPDGYDWQKNVRIEDVTKWLDGYGIGAFESDSEIEQEIYDATGEPNYVGKIYPIEFGDKKLNVGAIVKDDVTYIPAAEISNETNVKYTWSEYDNRISSEYGTAYAFDKKGKIYIDANDAQKIFHASGALTDSNIYQVNPTEQNKKDRKKDKPSRKDRGGKGSDIQAPTDSPAIAPIDVRIPIDDSNQKPNVIEDPSIDVNPNDLPPADSKPRNENQNPPMVFDDYGNPLDEFGNIIPPKSEESEIDQKSPKSEVEEKSEVEPEKKSEAKDKKSKSKDKKSQKSKIEDESDQTSEKKSAQTSEQQSDTKSKPTVQTRDPKDMVFDDYGNPLDDQGNIIRPAEDEENYSAR